MLRNTLSRKISNIVLNIDVQTVNIYRDIVVLWDQTARRRRTRSDPLVHFTETSTRYETHRRLLFQLMCPFNGTAVPNELDSETLLYSYCCACWRDRPRHYFGLNARGSSVLYCRCFHPSAVSNRLRGAVALSAAYAAVLSDGVSREHQRGQKPHIHTCEIFLESFVKIIK